MIKTIKKEKACEVVRVEGCSLGAFLVCKTHGWACASLATHPMASKTGNHILFQNAK
jgi:hypothetical protein